VAVLQDYDSRWAIEWQRYNRVFDPVKSIMSFYRPLHTLARSVDVVSDTAPLSRYKLVVAPALNVLTPQAAENPKKYVREGGHLVLGQRSAMKDQDNSLFPQRQPGPFADLLGARVEQFYALDQAVPVAGQWGESETTVWAEQLGVTASDAQVLMRYGKSNGWLDDQPAAVTRKVGKGSITYIGASLDKATMRRAAEWMLSQAGLSPVLPGIPEGVDVALRSDSGKRILILTNFTAGSQTVPLPAAMDDVLASGIVSKVTLPQYGVAVLHYR